MKYSNITKEEQELIDIIIGMCLPRPKFPTILFDNGYQIKKMEKAFNISNGNEVKPDIIVAAEEKGSLIIFEAKSGKNADEEQADNYSNINEDDLIKNAGFNKDLIGNGFDVSYLCYKKVTVKKEEKQGFKNLIKSFKSNHNFPVLVFNKEEKELKLKLYKFEDQQLNDIFNKPITIPLDRLPTFIKFNERTKIDEIKPEIIRTIISYTYRDKLKFTIKEILEEIISPFPGFINFFGTRFKKAMMKKIKMALKQLGDKHSKYIEWDTDNKEWCINESLSDLHPMQLKMLAKFPNDIDLNTNQMDIYEYMDEF